MQNLVFAGNGTDDIDEVAVDFSFRAFSTHRKL
jgi:hypothetical protein